MKFSAVLPNTKLLAKTRGDVVTVIMTAPRCNLIVCQLASGALEVFRNSELTSMEGEEISEPNNPGHELISVYTDTKTISIRCNHTNTHFHISVPDMEKLLERGKEYAEEFDARERQRDIKRQEKTELLKAELRKLKADIARIKSDPTFEKAKKRKHYLRKGVSALIRELRTFQRSYKGAR